MGGEGVLKKTKIFPFLYIFVTLGESRFRSKTSPRRVLDLLDNKNVALTDSHGVIFYISHVGISVY